MALGTPKTQKFQIGSAEIRIGNLFEVGKLTSLHSVGLLENISVNFTQDTVDVDGGLPLTTYATAITKTGCTISADAKEFTAQNIGILLNKGDTTTVNSNQSSFSSVLSAATGINGTSFSLENPLASTRLRVASPTAADAVANVVATTGTVYLVDLAKDVIATFVVGSTLQFTATSGVVYNATLATVAASVSVAGVITDLTLTIAPLTHTVVAVGNNIASKGGDTADYTSSGDVTPQQTSTISSATSTTAITVPVEFAKALNVKDLIVTYPAGSPEKLSVVEVVTVDKTTGAVTLKTALLNDAKAGDVIYKTNQVGLGGNSAMRYFTMDIISLDFKSAQPQGFRIWKAAITSGLDYKFSSSDFGSTPMGFKALAPLPEEYSATGDLVSMANLADKHRYGFWFGAPSA